MEPFALERYFATHEFSAPYLLSPSDTEPRTLSNILEMADSECRGLWESLSLGYTESRGLPALRDAIAAFVTGSSEAPDETITGDDVLVFSCAEEAIYTVSRVLVRRGDDVACTWPAYQSLYQVAHESGANVYPIPTRIVEGLWDLNANEIDTAIRDGTRLVIANVPHNPTGMVPSPKSWTHLCGRVRDSGALLFADEVYRPLASAGHALPASPVTIADLPSISLGSVSKAFGLAGVRIGWVVCRDAAVLRSLEEYKDYTTICASAPAELLALIALRNWRQIVSEQQSLINSNGAALASFVDRWNTLVEGAPIGAGSTCFPIWRGQGTAREMAERAVASAGIMILPGDTFDPRMIGPGADGLARRFRVGLGRRALPEILERFGDHLSRSY